MKKQLIICLLLSSIVGCGKEAAFKRLVGTVKKDADGNVIELSFRNRQDDWPGGPRQLEPTEFELLATRKELKRLSLQNTGITDEGLVYTKDLAQLEFLDLTGTKVTDAGLVHLKGLTKLRVLRLKWTRISGSGLTHLQELTNLEELDFSNSLFMIAGLEHLRSMTSLKNLNLNSRPSLHDCALISDGDLEHLKGLTCLESLDLDGTEVTEAGLADLQKALPNCKIKH